jgi:hypothetical protein
VLESGGTCLLFLRIEAPSLREWIASCESVIRSGNYTGTFKLSAQRARQKFFSSLIVQGATVQRPSLSAEPYFVLCPHSVGPTTVH